MKNKKLCSSCKTGKITYETDNHSPYCPYIRCFSGRKCTMYVRDDTQKKSGIFTRIFNYLK